MAVMNATERLRCRIGLIRDYKLLSFTKPNLDAAIVATDDWIDTNAVSYNLALPVNFRTNATPQEKTLLFCIVALRRAGLLKVQEDG